jgi:hypothetical protein
MRMLRALALPLLASLVLGAGCTSDPPAAASADLGIDRLARLKTEAEDWAKRIKADFAAGSPERRDAETKYIAARAAVDGWIAQYKLELARGTPDPQTAAFRNALAQAGDKGQQYVDYVNALYVRGSISPGSVTLIGDVYKILKQVVTDVLDRLSTDREKRRKAIVEVIDTLKWKSFPEL